MFAVAGPVCRVACLWFVVSGLFEGVGFGVGHLCSASYFMNDVDKIAGGGGSISSAVARSVAVRRMSAALYGAY